MNTIYVEGELYNKAKEMRQSVIAGIFPLGIMIGILLVVAIEAKQTWLLVFALVGAAVFGWAIFTLIDIQGGTFYIIGEGIVIESSITKKIKKIRWEDVGQVRIVDIVVEGTRYSGTKENYFYFAKDPNSVEDDTLVQNRRDPNALFIPVNEETTFYIKNNLDRMVNCSRVEV